MTLCSPASPDVRGAWHRRRAHVALALACAGLAIAPHPASAVGLGAVTQQSALGQSLRVVVPVTLGEGEDVASECFRIVAAQRDADGVPQVQFGRVGVERSAAGTALVVTNARPVNDPVIRLTLEAGCEAKMRREYTLLMDPPAIEAPVVAGEPAPREVTAAPAPAPAAREARRPARSPARAAARSTTRPAPSAGIGEGSETARRSTPAKGRAAAKPAPSRPPAVAADRPRLAVSSGAPGAANEADRERARQEKAAAIEAETQVLRQRIVELTALVEKMQEELRAQERAEQAAAEATKSAPPEAAPGAPKEPSAATQVPAAATVQEPAKAPAAKAPLAADGDWWDNNGTLIGVVLILPFLLAAFLLWRRRRAAEDEQWRAARIPASRGTQTMQGTTTALRNPVAGLVSPRTEAASTLSGTETAELLPGDVAVDALAVSELSHATEEARVFVALGHTERAIEVLLEHVRRLPRSMPAAWLMLLDLYHVTGNRAEFRKLAEDFHEHFNVQTPPWEAFASDDRAAGGIESFPHVQKQVVELWRKPGCRSYLERLLYDNREGRRNGFPLSTYSDILLLLQVLDAPEQVDIDSDLVESGKLETAPKPAAPSRARRPMPPDPAASRPVQQPIRFDLDPPSSQGKP